MLIFHASNHTETLAAAMAHIMRERALEDPFDAEILLIQSAGMGTWLTQTIAQENSIAAHIDSVHPASYVWRLIRQLRPGQSDNTMFEKASLRWEILRVLPEKLFDARYAPLHRYLVQLAPESFADGAVPGASVLLPMAEAIADVFDAYLNYRPDWITRWETDGASAKPPEALATPAAREQWRWQADLWLSVYPQLPLAARSHRVRQLQWLERQLPQLDLAEQGRLPERLFIFGLHTLPPAWLNLFLELAQWTDVHWLAGNPCRHYWCDIQHPQQQLRQQQLLAEREIAPQDAHLLLEQNTLLASWGRAGRDYLSLVLELDSDPRFVEIGADLFEASIDAETASALAFLQHDLCELRQERRAVASEDDSIRFAACHSRLREVEALHDYILAQLAEHNDLSPRDILVMVPDIEAYAPLVRAVFARDIEAENGSVARLPFSISDQSFATEMPLMKALQAIVTVNENRLALTEVFDWFEHDALREAAGFSSDDVSVLRAWLAQLNVRWGLHAEHRNQLLNCKGSSGKHTWFRAVQRLLAGMICAPWETATCLDYESYLIDAWPAAPPSLDIQEMIGKLIDFLVTLDDWRLSMQRVLVPEEALSLLADFIATLVDYEHMHESTRRLLTQQFDTMATQLSAVTLPAVSVSVIAKAWLAGLDEGRVSQRFFSGRINFCTLMPLRSIPFKVVAMLGMNEGAFPRQQERNPLDLILLDKTRVGDRSRRDDDRYLFLEALCSARQKLYISYEGFSAVDNSTRYPSILVAELRDYCAQYFYLNDAESLAAPAEKQGERLLAHWTCAHRLQPFHPSYFDPDRADHAIRQSFAQEWLRLGRPPVSTQDNPNANSVSPGTHSVTSATEEAQDALDDHELNDWVQQLNQPFRAYYRHLGLTLDGLPAPEAENEPFALDGLDIYALKTELADTWLRAISDESVRQRWEAEDRLPAAPMGYWQFESTRDELVGMQERLLALQPVKAERVHWISAASSGGVSGEVWLSQQGRIELCFAKGPERALWGAWCRHVLWSCAGAAASSASQVSYLLGPRFIWTLPALSSEQARDYAEALHAVAVASHIAPVCFAPRTAFALLFGSESKAHTALFGAPGFNGGSGISGEWDDAYWQRWQRWQRESGETINSIARFGDAVSAHPLWQQLMAVKDALQEEKW